MAWSFGDGFDLYAAVADMTTGYWDSGNGNGTFSAGRFTGSQCFIGGIAGPFVVKSSGQNDAVHHFCVAMQQTVAVSGSSLYFSLQLADGATPQCSIVFRSDGAILLASGGVTGTVLATYTGAFPVINTWYQFEFEVVINNTTGSFAVRKNGNSTNDFSATSLNTRGGTANNYANRFNLTGNASSTGQKLDDLFWRSDASAVAWMGDIRCYTRMPASEASIQFASSLTNFFAQNAGNTGGAVKSANQIYAASVVSPGTGILASLSVNLSAFTGHMKMALYNSTGSTLLASSVEITNPSAGVTAFSVSSGPTVQRGTTYLVAVWSDFGFTSSGNSDATARSLTATYGGSFPATLTGSTVGSVTVGTFGMNVTANNVGSVSESQQDALTSYVYDSTPGHADLYNIATIGSTPATVFAVTTRAYAQKSDAGTRTAAVNLKSPGQPLSPARP